uniref:DNA-binding domain-containing protein n=1 Tax=Candidatus Kentrum eta TaxID=2126337 RepID=A0A450UHR0_9GAMM|nr:MAG: Putative DNA-binding domain-containing protein [Candidatus Kentron sp. H]VFJ93079.1 MAG: Putative DNA-binding domain-containing protein [Candidatus Kentron sp. H]VFJ99930.1 MAG: Putative DNA-binding domain-containing protein [Candidatus Kentron sp. H]
MTEEIINPADVRMLVVEDNPRYWEALRQYLEKDYGYRDVELAENPRQAIKRLETGRFDVFIADMHFGEDIKGGFSVLHEVKARNITSIVIILTANDNWRDCRGAFRGGAWDYLSKTMPGEDVMEILHQSILDGLAYAQKYGSRSDELWIVENREQLRREHPDRYIAVINNTVIDSDADREGLLSRIREYKLPLRVPIVQHMKVEDISELSIEELIRRGEGERLEFKRSLGEDTQEGRKEKGSSKGPSNVLKTIAAFLNSEGGVLLIGVEDDGAVFGLETDYAALGSRPNWDGFSQALTNRITDAIGATFMGEYIKIEPHSLEGKAIAVVRVRKASSPAFIDKKYFCIRAGATNRSLDMEESCRYLSGRMRWVFE